MKISLLFALVLKLMVRLCSWQAQNSPYFCFIKISADQQANEMYMCI